MLIRMYDVYASVINILQRENFVEDDGIAKAIDDILKTYSNDGLLTHADGIDFNMVASRCAYIYLYGTSHAHLVYSSLHGFRQAAEWEFMSWIHGQPPGHRRNLLGLSIGGGPGTDLVGLLLFLQPVLTNVNCTVVDAYNGWEEVLEKTLTVLETRSFFHSLNINYIKEDLLKPLTREMKKRLGAADFITMSKFVSAITASSATAMRLRAMFQLLHLGALVYFVDNAGGDAFSLGERVAAASGLVPVWGPIYHHQFRIDKQNEPMEEVLACPRFGGIRPQTSTKISVVIWKKAAYPRRGLKRTLTSDTVPFNVLRDRNRPNLVARRRIAPVRARSKTASCTEELGRSKQQTHRRVASEVHAPRRDHLPKRVVQLLPKRGTTSPYNLRTIPDSFNTPSVRMATAQPQSPYSYTDLSFNVPISPMVPVHHRIVNENNQNIFVPRQRGEGTPYSLRNLQIGLVRNRNMDSGIAQRLIARFLT